MKTKHLIPSFVLAVLASLSTINPQLSASTLGTAFTYQGKLTNGGQTAQGIYDFRFAIFDSAGGDNLVAGPITNSAVGVTNGLFIVTLDFGTNVFSGDARWLEIGVRTNGSSSFATLLPRQALTPSPYALYAPNAGFAGTAKLADSVAPGSITGTALAVGAVDSSRIADGTIVSSNLSPTLLANTFWRLDGNSGTTAGTQFVGTSDNQSMELKVNNQRALRVEPNSYGTPNWIGGSSINSVDEGVAGATIGGGGALNLFGRNYTNRVAAFLGTIAGGGGNMLLPGADMSAVGGGYYNTLEGTFSSVIAGGGWNSILSEANLSAVGGGQYNSILPGADYSTIAGGVFNLIGTNASMATVGGGAGNRIDTLASDTVIAGGNGNTIGFEAIAAAIGGGVNNEAQTSAAYSTIPGGRANTIHSNALYSAIGGGRLNAIQTNAQSALISGGENNVIGANDSYTTIGGGGYNQVGDGSINATIGGGMMGTIGANAANATISGGGANTIEDNAIWSAIGGGINNDIGTNAMSATIAGGRINVIEHYAANATIGGGFQNRIQAFASGAGIGAGENNVIGLGAFDSTISGGLSNTVAFNTKYAVIQGGKQNTAGGDYSFAAGRRAKANHHGAFVWADSTDADFASTTSNQFNIRASGGLRFVTGGLGVVLDGQPVLSGVVQAGQLGPNVVTDTEIANGSISGADVNPATFSNVFWKVDGNAGTTTGTHFLGTTDNQPLDLRVNGVRAFRLERNNGGAPNVIGGSPGNLVGAEIRGVTIAGGDGNQIGTNSDCSVIGGGYDNTIFPNSSESTIAGGGYNDIGTTAYYSAIGGGANNNIAATSVFATIAGGNNNNISTNSHDSTVGGGNFNTIEANSGSATISGGNGNTILENSSYAAIGGGNYNEVGTNSAASAIGGGGSNTIGTNSVYSLIGGGFGNKVAAGSPFASILGGRENQATNYALAAGRRAKANHTGSFVWADSTDADFSSTGTDQVAFRAAGGVWLRGRANLNLLADTGTDPGDIVFADGSGQKARIWSYTAAGSGLLLSSGDNKADIQINSAGWVGIGRDAAGNNFEVEGNASKTTAGSWLANSDARIKQDIHPVTGALDKLAQVRLVSFRYTDDYRQRHPSIEDRAYVNVVAQEFQRVFPAAVTTSGEKLPDGESILQVDTYPLTIYSAAAVQELSQKLEQKETEITELKVRLERLEQLFNAKNGGMQ
jgi:hypothetical protein